MIFVSLLQFEYYNSSVRICILRSRASQASSRNKWHRNFYYQITQLEARVCTRACTLHMFVDIEKGTNASSSEIFHSRDVW